MVTDGIVARQNWERIDSVPSNEDWKISFANGQFVRVKGTYYNGGNYNIYEYRLSTSSDGANWSTTIHDWLALGYHTANTSDRVYASGNRFFLRTGKETYVSTNALNWSLLSRDNYIYQGVGNGGTHIATNGQHLARSPDGSTYTGISSLVGRHFSDLAISGSTAVATGYGGLMATSTDQGQSWQLIEGLFPDPVGNSVTDYDLVGLDQRAVYRLCLPAFPHTQGRRSSDFKRSGIPGGRWTAGNPETDQ
jgi:hypothetical protein